MAIVPRSLRLQTTPTRDSRLPCRTKPPLLKISMSSSNFVSSWTIGQNFFDPKTLVPQPLTPRTRPPPNQQPHPRPLEPLQVLWTSRTLTGPLDGEVLSRMPSASTVVRTTSVLIVVVQDTGEKDAPSLLVIRKPILLHLLLLPKSPSLLFPRSLSLRFQKTSAFCCQQWPTTECQDASWCH